MAEGVEGDARVCDKTVVKTDNDQILKMPVDDRIGMLLNNDLNSDIKFAVNGETFHAHKFVLSYASEVFHAMFYGPLADDREEIEIVDCEKPEDFLEFLSIIYKKSAKVTWETVRQLSYLRKKYMIMETRPFSDFIKSIVNIDNCLDALDVSATLEEDAMVEECLNVIRRDITALIMTERFLELSQAAMKAILKQNMLNINELDLFLAVDKWCTYQVELKRSEGEKIKKREVLGDALYHIRFPVIKLNDFIVHCRPSMLLTNKEIVNLYDTYLLNPDTLDSSCVRKSSDEDDGNVTKNESDFSDMIADFIKIPRVKGNTIVPIIDREDLYASSVPQAYCSGRGFPYPHDQLWKLTITVNMKTWLVGLHILGSWMEFIEIEGLGKIKLQCVMDRLARLEKPLCLEPLREYFILCRSAFNDINTSVSRYPRSATYAYHGFQCSVVQLSPSYVSTISKLIFSIFDANPMDHAGSPLLNMTATVHCARDAQN